MVRTLTTSGREAFKKHNHKSGEMEGTSRMTMFNALITEHPKIGLSAWKGAL
jgi:hypothetical protein